ncbi:MAG TPA: hypothetical protein VNJ12_10025, partial [Candidatus Dormibacteraeota bacterium]|nr:hypothetical protein [Candidatus Dormibacteraeota bacterium]
MPGAIAKLRIEGLFGQFDYEFPKAESGAQLPADVLVLYGDNGSGKTTLLNLIFHSLSPANNRGHRNAIKKIPFKRFELTLSGGEKIAITRDSELVGGYCIYAERPGGATLQTNFSIQREGKFASDDHERDFIAFLKRTGQSVYFLRADRGIFSDELPLPDAEAMLRDSRAVGATDEAEAALRYAARFPLRMSARLTPEILRGPSLMQAMQLAADWITQQVLRAAKRGTGSTQGIYSQVVKSIAASVGAGEEALGDEAVSSLASTLESLAARSRDYARFGFVPELRVQEMLNIIRSAQVQALLPIIRVLQPYVESTGASFDQLAPVHRVTSVLIDSLGGFYAHKSVSFNVNTGFAFRTLRDSKRIDPTWLSSG